MMHPPEPVSMPYPIEIACRDGVVLHGDLWSATAARHGTVIINPATGVAARYYARYAAFLASHGFDVVTYDYRGIGRSAPASLRGCIFRWRDWGDLDFDAVLRFAKARDPDSPLMVVGHSFGGVLPALAESAHMIDSMLTVGAQFGRWPNYAARHRLRLVLKWHVAMPALTALCGYFPGGRLGWCEDLPAGVAYEWALHRLKPEVSPDMRRRFAALRTPILAVAVSDDPLGTVQAVRRGLDCYAGSTRTTALLSPADFDRPAIGHFGLFHERHAADFWLDTLLWLRDGRNPWPDRSFPPVEQNDPALRGRRHDIVRYY